MQTLQQTGCDAYLIALVCLSTGARWGEAQKLTKADIQNGQIRFHETKSKQPRSVPISQNLQDRLNAVLQLCISPIFGVTAGSCGISRGVAGSAACGGFWIIFCLWNIWRGFRVKNAKLGNVWRDKFCGINAKRSLD